MAFSFQVGTRIVLMKQMKLTVGAEPNENPEIYVIPSNVISKEETAMRQLKRIGVARRRHRALIEEFLTWLNLFYLNVDYGANLVMDWCDRHGPGGCLFRIRRTQCQKGKMENPVYTQLLHLCNRCWSIPNQWH